MPPLGSALVWPLNQIEQRVDQPTGKALLPDTPIVITVRDVEARIGHRPHLLMPWAVPVITKSATQGVQASCNGIRMNPRPYPLHERCGYLLQCPGITNHVDEIRSVLVLKAIVQG